MHLKSRLIIVSALAGLAAAGVVGPPSVHADGKTFGSLCSTADFQMCSSASGFAFGSAAAQPSAAEAAVAAQVAATPGVAAIAFVGGRCCLVIANPGARPNLAIQLDVNPPYSTNICRYHTTSYFTGTFSGNGVEAIDNNLGTEEGSQAQVGFIGGTSMGSAKTEVGVQVNFPAGSGGGTWNGDSVTVTYPWHIRGTLSADQQGVIGFSGSASASVNLNLANTDFVAPAVTLNAMSDSVDQGSNGSLKSVARDYSDNVTNQTTMYFAISDNSTHAAFIQSISQTSAQSVIAGNAEADADFATGNIQTRQGPQAWLDYEDWQFHMPPGWTISDCGPS